MTIDEAIKHCEEVAEEQERKAQCMGRQFVGTAMGNYQNGCFKCAADHRQLAEWLTELQQKRDAVKHLSEWNRKLTDYKNEMVCKYGESQEQLAEAKRLLKAAVEDMHIEDMCDVCVERIQNSPIHCPDGSNCFVWRYKDEALKLIGGSENE